MLVTKEVLTSTFGFNPNNIIEHDQPVTMMNGLATSALIRKLTHAELLHYLSINQIIILCVTQNMKESEMYKDKDKYMDINCYNKTCCPSCPKASTKYYYIRLYQFN